MTTRLITVSQSAGTTSYCIPAVWLPHWQMTSFQFLTKQTAALKEVNESRVRIYEQIEISLSELETNNLRLSEDSAVEKSKIKRLTEISPELSWLRCWCWYFSLTTTVTALENKCGELQRSLEEAEIIIRNRKERRNSIFLQQNPNSDSLCLVAASPQPTHLYLTEFL